MWFLFMFSGEADRTPLFSQQGGLDPETSMIGKATAGVEEEVLVSLCIIYMAHVNMLVNKASLIYTVHTYLFFVNSVMKEHRKANT